VVGAGENALFVRERVRLARRHIRFDIALRRLYLQRLERATVLKGNAQRSFEEKANVELDSPA
jgi:hypothetical protein